MMSKRHWNKKITLLLLLVSAVCSLLLTPDPHSAEASSPPWWNVSWTARHLVTIQNQSYDVMKSGYTITLDITNMSRSLPNGNDVRVVYWNGSTNTELDRDFETDSNTGRVYVRFEIQAPIAGYGSNSTAYWIYSMNSGAGSPPANLSNVYQHYTDFTTGSWSDSGYWGSQSGCVTMLNGVGAQFAGGGSQCVDISPQSYGSGYAQEFTAEYTASGYSEFDFFSSPNGIINVSISGSDWAYHTYSVSNNSSATQDSKIAVSLNQFHVFSLANVSYRGAAHFNIDFTDQYDPGYLNSVPGGNLSPAIESYGTVVVSQYRLRYAVDPEPIVTSDFASSYIPTNVYGQGGSYTSSGANVNSINTGYANGLAVDSAGNLYVAGDDRVVEFSPGSFTAGKVWGQGSSCTNFNSSSKGVDANSLNGPEGITVDSSGNLYVADTENNRVLEFPSGSGCTASKVWGQGSSCTNFTDGGSGISTTALNGPQGVVVDSSGNVYIADSENYRVLDFPSGSCTASKVWGQGAACNDFVDANWGTSATNFDHPVSVALDSSGDLYVGDEWNEEILEFPAGSGCTASKVWGVDATCTNFTSGGTGNLDNIGINDAYGISVDAGGNLYAIDEWDNRVLEFPAGSGCTASKVWVNGSPCNDFTDYFYGVTAYNFNGNQLNWLTVDGSGNLYVSDDTRVLEFPVGPGCTATKVWGVDTTGTNFTTRGGNPDATTLANPYGMVTDSSGNLYVADEGNRRVLYFPKGSTTATKVYGQGSTCNNFTSDINTITSSTYMTDPTSVTLDQYGNLYVSDSSRVLEFPNGQGCTATKVWGQGTICNNFTVNNWGGTPTSTDIAGAEQIAVDNSGNLYVADGYNNRVLEFPVGSGCTATKVYGQGSACNSFTTNAHAYTSTGFYEPIGLVLDSSSNLYVTDYYGNRILEFPAGSGCTATKVYGQGSGCNNFTGHGTGISATALDDGDEHLAIDSQNNLYIADSLNYRVLMFPSGSGCTATRVYGQLTGVFTDDISGVTQTNFNQPRGIALDNNGNMYVSDDTANRILQFQLGLVTTTQPSTVNAGASITAGFTAEDAGSGLTFTDFTGPVTAGITSGTGTSGAFLNGPTTMNATAGVASYSTVTIDRPGTGYALTASSPGYISAITSTFNINGAITPGTLTGVSLTISNTQTSTSNVTYSWQFTTVTSGNLNIVDFTVPTGTSGTPTIASYYGVDPGTVTLSGTTLSYTITSPSTVPVGIPIFIAISGLTNTTANTSGFTSVIATNTGSTIVDTATTAAITIGANNTTITLNVAEVGNISGPALSTFTLEVDPATNKTASTSDSGFAIISNAPGWNMEVYDNSTGLKSSRGAVINPVSSGVASAVAWPSAIDQSVFGYTLSGLTYDSCTTGCVAATVPNNWNSSSKYAGLLHGSSSPDTFLTSYGPTGSTATRFTITYKVGVTFAAPAGAYTDTVTYILVPGY